MSDNKNPIEILAPEKRPKLRLGAKGKAVELLQSLLNIAFEATPPMRLFMSVDGDFGQGTKDGVMLFQYRFGLPINGVVDAAAWRKLDDIANPLFPLFQMPAVSPVFLGPFCQNDSTFEPQMILATIAAPYIGATETGDNRMGDDSRMQEIFAADNLTVSGNTDGYPWCAAFVSLCVQKLIQQYPCYYIAVTPPREPSVSNFRTEWAVHQGCLIFSPRSKVIIPVPGDIVVFTFSHIGIVESVADGLVDTIEGNTNQAGSREGKEVARKTRPNSQIRAFIRLPVKRN